MSLWWLFLFCAISYLIGCLNFTAILAKYKFKTDISKVGSGNPGATNMLRNFGFKWGLLILILDIVKGIVPAVMGVIVFGNGYNANPVGGGVTNGAGQIGMYACGLSAVLGHCWPITRRFRGGKGVATTIGVFFVINPLIGVLALAFGFLLGFVFDNATLSSFSITSICLLWEGFINNPGVTVSSITIAIYVVVLFKHRGNIYRLLKGTDKPAGLMKKRNKAK